MATIDSEYRYGVSDVARTFLQDPRFRFWNEHHHLYRLLLPKLQQGILETDRNALLLKDFCLMSLQPVRDVIHTHDQYFIHEAAPLTFATALSEQDEALTSLPDTYHRFMFDKALGIAVLHNLGTGLGVEGTAAHIQLIRRRLAHTPYPVTREEMTWRKNGLLQKAQEWREDAAFYASFQQLLREQVG